jgi:hypothetical protein
LSYAENTVAFAIVYLRPLLLMTTATSICHPHNLAHAISTDNRFGIRVKLRSTDPFRKLIGDNWQKEHWFATAQERDQALVEMSERYVYFRPGDQPTLTFEKLNK